MASTEKVFIDGSTSVKYDADDANGMKLENNTLILSTGQTLNTADNLQTSKSVAVYASKGDFYVEDGSSAPNVYVVVTSDAQSGITQYKDGLRIRFKVVNQNTGPSTINVNSLGVRALRYSNTTLISGMLKVGEYASFIYNESSGLFNLFYELTDLSLYLDKDNGRVGVGNNNPTVALDVTGEIAIRGAEGVDDARMFFLASNKTQRFTIETDFDGTATNDLLGIRSTSVDNMLVLKGDGNIGIGTNTPQVTLVVSRDGSNPTWTGIDTYMGQIITSSGNTGLGILSGATSTSFINFSDGANNFSGRINYSNNTDIMTFYAGTNNIFQAETGLFSTASAVNVKFDNGTFYCDGVNNRIGVLTSSPQADFHVNGSSRFDGSVAMLNGALTVGVDDTTPGSLTLHGNTTGSVTGGKIIMDLAADHDTTFNSYQILIDSDNFRIARTGIDTPFTINGSTGNVDVSNGLTVASTTIITGGALNVGVNDTTKGILELYGSATGSVDGGQIHIYNPVDHDTTVSFYEIRSVLGAFSIARAGFSESIGISDTTGNIRFNGNTAYVDAVNNRLGVGTSTPAEALDVVGHIKSSGIVRADTGIIARAGNTALKTKLITLINFNMNVTTATKSIAHGLTLSNIRKVEVIIRGDDGKLFDTAGPNSTSQQSDVCAGWELDGTNFILRKMEAPGFQSTNFNATTGVRAYIIISYI